jgi:hypothetical protein
MESMWTAASGPALSQGDCLPSCRIPLFPVAYAERDGGIEVPVGYRDLVIITQSWRGDVLRYINLLQRVDVVIKCGKRYK